MPSIKIQDNSTKGNTFRNTFASIGKSRAYYNIYIYIKHIQEEFKFVKSIILFTIFVSHN